MGSLSRLRVQFARSGEMLDIGEAMMVAAREAQAAGETVFWNGLLPNAIADARAAARRINMACDEAERLNEAASGEDRE